MGIRAIASLLEAKKACPYVGEAEVAGLKDRPAKPASSYLIARPVLEAARRTGPPRPTIRR